jgi:hypothetical protein
VGASFFGNTVNMICNIIANVKTMTFNTAAGTAQIDGVYPNQLNIQAANVFVLGNLSFYGTGFNFDLATNNIINANVTRTTTLSTNTISTNIVNAGYLVGLLPGNTAATSVSPLAVTNGAAYLSFSPQIEFQYYTGGFKHFMGSRHYGGVTNNFGNAIDFWLYSATGDSNASTTPGTCNVNTMSVTAAGVGIFNNSPSLALDVAGAGRFTAVSTNTISTSFISACNISSYSLSTTLGYFSTISSGAFYGKFIGDGSLITGISGGGSSAIPAFVSTNTLSTGILNVGFISSISTVTNTLLAPGSTILGITLSKMQIQTVTGTTLLFTGTTPILNSSISGINYILSNSGMSQVSIPIFASMSPQGQFDGWFMTLRNATASYLTLTTMTCNVNAAGYVSIPPANSLTLAYSPGNGYFGWVQF